jgi:hypothetical protein
LEKMEPMARKRCVGCLFWRLALAVTLVALALTWLMIGR